MIADEHRDWLRKFLPLPQGVPSHDTFRRVFRLLEPEDVTLRMIDGIKTFREACGGAIIAIDGKTLRRSGSKKKGLEMRYTVGAWATTNGLILGQTVVDDKSNEITAIPQWLDMLEIKGCPITIDAAGCQKNLATQIVEKQAHYVLAVQGNQPQRAAALPQVFAEGIDTNFAARKHECFRETETSPGRLEDRATHVIKLPEEFAHKTEWAKRNTLVVVIRNEKTAGANGDDTPEPGDQRIFISNHRFHSKVLRRAPRRHGSIANGLHWVLDVQFREDDHPRQDRNGAANPAFLRRLAVSLLRQDTQTKTGQGTQNKLLLAAANPHYILKLLANAEF